MPRLPDRFAQVQRFARKIFRQRAKQASAHGLDLYADIGRLLPNAEMSMVFDVGANTGQSALPISRAFNKATIHCFEPSSSTFNDLKVAIRSSPRIVPHRVALGDITGSVSLALTEKSTRRHAVVGDTTGIPTEPAPLSTIDEFCATNRVERIDFLKVDTEGYDLKVLQGALRMISGHLIGIVLVEAGFGPENDTHVPYSQLANFLENFDYAPFGFYDQKHEWKLQRPNLRRANVCFLSPSLILDKANAGNPQ